MEVQDQTKNGLWDDSCKGFPTTNGQNLVFGLPGKKQTGKDHKNHLIFEFKVCRAGESKPSNNSRCIKNGSKWVNPLRFAVGR